MALTESARKQIEDALSEHRVVLFMKGNKHFPQCGFSARVVKILKETGAPFHTVNVLADAEIRDGIKEFSDWPTIPQLYIDKEFVGGCDIVTEMAADGELQAKLGVEAPKPPALPKVTLSEAAATALRAAADEEGDVLHLGINENFAYELYYGPKEPGELEVVAEGSGLSMYFSADSARRADGLRIDFANVGGQGAFRIENPNEPPRVKSLQVEDLKALLGSDAQFVLVDVRTVGEQKQARLSERARLLDEDYARELGELPKDTQLVFHCHHGGRSRAAAERFLAQGFRNVFNVEGGIDAWSQRVDPSVPRY